MNLKRLAIGRLPGIRQPFAIEAEGQGFHVIFGPNGIGKSSICRAVECLYWDNRGPSRQTLVTGEFEWRGETWRGEREGSALRWNRGGEGSRPPVFPPSHNYRCFFLHLRDLIDTSPDGTADIAAEIHRQMSGGFDLDEVASILFSPLTRHRKRAERGKFNQARDAVRLADTNQSSLQKRVDRLEELQSALDDAETAAGRLPHVKRAIGLAKRREELAGVQERLEKFPGALANLTGNECDEVDAQQGQLARLEERARGLEHDLQQAREEKSASGLAAPLERADLATWRNCADELGRNDQALEAARTDLEKAGRRVASALAAAGGGDIDTAGLSLPEHGRLFEFLRASQAHGTRVNAIREKLRLLGGTDTIEEDERELERFRAAADALRSWLRLPEPESPGARLRRRLPWLLVAFVLLSAGVVLALAVDPSLVVIAALGAGIGLAALFVKNDPSAGPLRRIAQAKFENLGHEAPSHWDVHSVESALRSLEQDAAKLEASLQRERDCGVERKSLENELIGLAERRGALEAQRQELLAALGLEAPQPDAELVDMARALDELRLARGEYEAASGSVRRLEKSHGAHLEQLADALENYGEPRPDSTAAARARLNHLADRNLQLEKALTAEQTAGRQLEQTSADQNEKRAAISKLFAQANLSDGDLHGLRTLLDDLPRYRALETQRNDLDSKNDLDRGELAKAGEVGLSEIDVPFLKELESKFEHARLQAGGLRREISDINAELNQARRGSDMQDLLAAREEARAGLRDLRDKALFAAAGKFLIEDIEQEYEQTRLPRVFERARNHFSDFTRHSYELRLQKGNENPRLMAVDLGNRQIRELDELSDGTRAQLLLAARVAFAEEVEQGEVLPLFLDEALDQSDPRRFEAIARSLGCLARNQGRQIFYLTSDPLDVDRIRTALEGEDCEIAAAIDLGRIRTGAASVSGPEMLTVESPPAVPAPGGLAPEEYGAALGVPAFRPSLGFAEQHLLYVLWDDLERLHDFLTHGIELAGQWKTVSGTPLAERLNYGPITSSDIDFRLDLLNVFCELWKQGRGRGIDGDALQDSGSLTPRFFGDVLAIARELDGDPERLLAALTERRDSRLRGFQRRNVERLRRYMGEQGYIDDRPILSAREIQLRALATPAANSLADSVAIGCIRRWWGWAGKSSAVESRKHAGPKQFG